MESYKIKYIVCDDFGCSVVIGKQSKQCFKLGDATVKGKMSVSKTIDLPAKAESNLKVGQKIVALQDKYFGIADYVYLYHGGMSFNMKPASYDKYSCKCYIENLPNLFKDGKLDRMRFKMVMVRECLRRGLVPSVVAWRNLRNVFLLDAYSPLVRE
ncbi:MAG: hypothetical protein MJ165_04040 [Alphaproteobacteria bacterium]|nr:hypothetical protein [Alphaproteobacteria bacterium]